MRLLIIGGTVFVGRHLVQAALQAGHEVTIFNRGKQNPELFPQVLKLRGNRDGNLDALKERSFDAVIDTCGYVPRIVLQSAELLRGAVGNYTFISTCSVYRDKSKLNIAEDSELEALTDPSVEEVTSQTYGGLKALCERVVEQAFPGHSLIIRPGLIVGPYDQTDRFTYWPVRVANGGKVLAPGRQERIIQFIDARDLAIFTIKLIEAAKSGTYNAIGPDYELSMSKFLTECKAATASNAEFIWAGDKKLLADGVEPWSGLPLWIPDDHPMSGMLSMSNQKALSAGLKCRPVSETVSDTLAWYKDQRGNSELKAGLTWKREQELVWAIQRS